MSLKWFEKTVEYNFLARAIIFDTFNNISPLDGIMERAGDTLLEKANKWILIEFKKDKQSISTEKSKFKDYSAAKNELKTMDKHHFLIYGISELDMISKHKFSISLFAQTYFSDIAIGTLNRDGMKLICDSGLDFPKYLEYIQKLIKHKKGGDGPSSQKESSPDGGPDDGSGPNVPTLNNEVVAGINKSGEIVACIGFAEFMHLYQLAPGSFQEETAL